MLCVALTGVRGHNSASFCEPAMDMGNRLREPAPSEGFFRKVLADR
jgi:hypothetical protein